MPVKILGPRKRRTREHVIADQSVHYLEGFILAESHTAERISRDYGYDMVMTTFDDQGYAEPGVVFFQVKASARLDEVGTHLVHDLDIRDYTLDARANSCYSGTVRRFTEARILVGYQVVL